MALLAFFANRPMPSGDSNPRQSVELHQTGTFEGLSTDWATAPRLCCCRLTHLWRLDVGQKLDEKLLNLFLLLVADSGLFGVVVLAGVGLGGARTRAVLAGSRTHARVAQAAGGAAAAVAAAAPEVHVFWNETISLELVTTRMLELPQLYTF